MKNILTIVLIILAAFYAYRVALGFNGYADGTYGDYPTAGNLYTQEAK